MNYALLWKATEKEGDEEGADKTVVFEFYPQVIKRYQDDEEKCLMLLLTSDYSKYDCGGGLLFLARLRICVEICPSFQKSKSGGCENGSVYQYTL